MGKYSERKACIRRETEINRGRKKNRKEERKYEERHRKVQCEEYINTQTSRDE